MAASGEKSSEWEEGKRYWLWSEKWASDDLLLVTNTCSKNCRFYVNNQYGPEKFDGEQAKSSIDPNLHRQLLGLMI